MSQNLEDPQQGEPVPVGQASPLASNPRSLGKGENRDKEPKKKNHGHCSASVERPV